MPQPFRDPEKFTQMWDLFNYANEVTSGGTQSRLYGSSMVLVFWVVLFVVFLSSTDVVKSVMASSFIAFVFAVLFSLAGLASQYAVVFPGLFLFVSVLYDYIAEPDTQ